VSSSLTSLNLGENTRFAAIKKLNKEGGIRPLAGQVSACRQVGGRPDHWELGI